MKVGGDGAWHGPTRREGCLDGRNELARAAADLHALDRRVPDTLDSQGVRRSHNDHRLARARERDVCAARVGHKAEAEAAGGADGAQDDEIGLASLHRVDGEDGDVGEACAHATNHTAHVKGGVPRGRPAGGPCNTPARLRSFSMRSRWAL
eukprot:5083165-Prymnesium_polylepis.2